MSMAWDFLRLFLVPIDYSHHYLTLKLGGFERFVGTKTFDKHPRLAIFVFSPRHRLKAYILLMERLVGAKRRSKCLFSCDRDIGWQPKCASAGTWLQAPAFICNECH